MNWIARHLLVAMLATIAPTISHAQETLTEGDLIGEWVLPGNGSVIRANRCGDRFCDSDIRVEAPKRWDSAPRQARPGILIPQYLQKQGPVSWQGKLYNIRDGDTYEGTITLIDKNRLTFVRCLIGTLFCDTKVFHRIDPPKPPEPPKQEPRTVSADQPKPARPPAPKVKKPEARQPTRADFEDFLRESGSGVPFAGTEEEQVLFREFMAWRSKQQLNARTANDR
jgi:uncharacterized protein (DUF2147 family)